MRPVIHDVMAPMTAANRIVAVIAAGVVLVVAAIVMFLLLSPRTPVDEGPPFATPAPLPPRDDVTTPLGIAGLADADWVRETSQRTGIPATALDAYAGAAILKFQEMPQCGLSWTTLAGIGSVESDHGRHDGSTVAPDGTVTPPIYGIALDGSESDHIPDSDGGEIDGDATIDRAVGPMQFIPSSWENWAGDANGDGQLDPQNVYDASFAASNYLCRVSDAMASPEGWRTGIAGYNSAESYARAVASAANEYAAAVTD